MIMANPDTTLLLVYVDLIVKKNQQPFAEPIYDESSGLWIIDETLFPKTYASLNYTWGLRSYISAFAFQRHKVLPATSTMRPPMTEANVLLWVEKAKFIFDNLANLGRSGAETEIIRRAIVKKLTMSASQPVRNIQDVFTALIGREIQFFFHNSRQEYFLDMLLCYSTNVYWQ